VAAGYDPNGIAQVLTNLVSNAYNYSPKGTSIAVRARIVDEQAQVDVTDTGIGIPAEKKDWIYEQFAKVDSSNTGRGNGHGLGLRIVKCFVEELKGDIHVKTKVEQGTTFIVHLPMRIPLATTIVEEPVAICILAPVFGIVPEGAIFTPTCGS